MKLRIIVILSLVIMSGCSVTQVKHHQNDVFNYCETKSEFNFSNIYTPNFTTTKICVKKATDINIVKMPDEVKFLLM